MNKLSDLTLEDMTKTEDGMELSRKTVNFARIGKRDASGRSHLVSAAYSGMSIRLDYNAVKTALANNNLPQLRDMSDQFYRISGEYRRLVNYASQMLTFDYLIIPRVDPTTNAKKVQKGLDVILEYSKNAAIEETGYMVAFSVVKYGVFYGYEMELDNNQIAMLQLPIEFCRTRFKINGVYQVEFDVSYFDSFTKKEDKEDAFSGFPPEFEKAYKAYERDRTLAWFALDPAFARAHMLEDSTPLFSAIFLDLLGLDEYKHIDKEKLKLSLYTLLVQKIPLNKDNELALYMEEIVDLHTNARGMIKNDGIDVLTTPCDIEAVTIEGPGASKMERDNIERATNMVYTSAGTPVALFNAGQNSGSIGLSLSVKVDESMMFPLLKQFERWYQNKFIELSPGLEFGIMFPPITIFNQSEKITEYREAASYGFPTKLLALTALGVRQYDASFLLEYENNLMDLPNRMIPLSSSYTMSGKDGAPKSDEPLTEEGDSTRDKEKNKDRAKE